MVYMPITIPTTFVRAVRGLGDAQSDHTACLAAQAGYQAALAMWTKDKAAYDTAVKARSAAIAGQAASYAAAMAAYQTNHAKWVKVKAAHDAWAAAMAGKYSGYAGTVARLLSLYPAIKLAAGAPPCVSSTVHTQYVNACNASRLHGLGAYNWSPYNACFVSAYPVCTTDPVEPIKPGPEPQPPVVPVAPAAIAPLRQAPTAPAACAALPAAAAATAPVTTTSTVAPLPVPQVVPSDVVTEASLAPTAKSSGGLLVAGLLAAAVAGGIYLVARRKRAA